MTDLSEFEEIGENDELRRINRDLQRKLSKAQAKTADLVQAVRDGARDAFVIAGPPPPVPRLKTERRKGAPEVALLHLSDWQVGKATTTYNLEVAAARLDLLGEKIEKITLIERADHPVRELYVMLGGDMVEGVRIFPGQEWEVEASLFEQVAAAATCSTKLLRRLLSLYETVHVWEEYGNHGRLGKRGEYPRDDNADLLVYSIVRDALRGNERRLVWNGTNSWYQIVTIGEYRALLVHGDEVKSFGGNIPAFGIAKKVNAWASGVIEPFIDCYMGHWHQPLVIPLAHGRGRTFVNPSLESGNVYAQEFVGATGTPGQRLHFIDPVRGRVTTERILWLD